MKLPLKLRAARFLLRVVNRFYSKFQKLRKYVENSEREIRQLEAAAMYAVAKERRQAACSHLKGGRSGLVISASQDYAVYLHTHIDGHREIRCLAGCSKLWTKDSPDWDRAIYMVEHSSNKSSSSEVPMYAEDRECPEDAPVSKQSEYQDWFVTGTEDKWGSV